MSRVSNGEWAVRKVSGSHCLDEQVEQGRVMKEWWGNERMRGGAVMLKSSSKVELLHTNYFVPNVRLSWRWLDD